MFNLRKVNKEKIYANSAQISSLLEELKQLREKQKELSHKIANIANDQQDYEEYYGEINKIKAEELKISKVQDSEYSDPKFAESAKETMVEIDREFKNDKSVVKNQGQKVDLLEEEDIEFEKKLEKVTKEIIKKQEKIRALEEKNEILTEKLELGYGQ